VYTLPVTVWLMIMQRLSEVGTLAAAVEELVNGNGWDVLEPCRRVREGRISANTGAYSQARVQVPVEAARRVAQHTFERLYEALPGAGGLHQRLFLLDGSSVELAHTKEIRKVYGLAKNQFGESHWPVMKVTVMHHVATGLALPPAYGPMYGPDAVGEQQLSEQLMTALPSSSVVIADRNFGVFSVVWQAAELKHDVVIRMMRSRAAKLHGDLSVGDWPVVWEATSHDRRSHPDLPPGAQVRGRLVVREAENGAATDKEPLYLFTTLTESAETVAALYKERWHIETDLRSLKEQVKLHSISAKTPQMAATELLLAVAAWNLIRAVMGEAARQIGIEPRRLSFSRSRSAFRAFTRAVSPRCSPEKFKHHWTLLLRILSQSKLPNRQRPSQPRKIWGKQSAFPLRKKLPEGEN
jgi:DDE family transposase